MTPEQFNCVQTAANSLNDAMKGLRILKSLEWGAGQKIKFFEKGRLPKPKYPALNLSETRDHLKTVRSTLTGDHVVLAWLRRIADDIETTTLMLETRGTPAFSTHSQALYGVPSKLLIDRKTRTIDLATHIDETLSDLDLSHLVIDGYEETFDAHQFAATLAPHLKTHFGKKAPSVEITPILGAKASAGSKRIRLRADAEFTGRDVQQLLQHEALVHVATGLNGRAQTHFPVLGRAHAGATEIQEGLAVFAEMVSGAMDPRRFQRLADRVIAIQMSLDGADFKEVFDFYEPRSLSPDAAFENTRRIFRGGVITGGAPFTKDMVYLGGLLRVHNFMRTVVGMGRADLIRLLFVGKLDLEDVPALAFLMDAGKLDRPVFMPTWVKDMRFLVSYMAYSGFLNQVKLPGFQTYYAELLTHVPTIWEE